VARRFPLLVLSLLLVGVLTCANEAGAAPPPPNFGAVFDDFDGPAGAPPSSTYWTNEPVASKELHTYTSSPENIHLDGQGHLVIQALKTPTGYTSGRLVSRDKLDMTYGKIAARIKFPTGQGIHPGFWLKGSSPETGSWLERGEIDIMELLNSGTAYHVTLHGPNGDSDYLDRNGLESEGPTADLTTDFHTYWADWRPDTITIGVDDITLGHFTPSSLPPGARWVFNNNPMYAVLNIVVGGWIGPPDESTSFPATMLVDWFRYTP
jgi:beta-glucanase (GH16 family)